MQNEVHVMERLALLGQATVIYAAPGTGKTLMTIWMLTKAIDNKKFDPNNLFYVNADDTLTGVIDKNELAERYGFHVLAPGWPEDNPFRPADLLSILRHLTETNQATDKIIILDTLKKFISLMDKQVQQLANPTLREFVMKGGTIIALAHTNKHLGANGKPVPEGTNDILNDIDCSYIVSKLSVSEGRTTVLFENQKARGNVQQEASYSYDSQMEATWVEKFESVRTVHEDERAMIAAKKATADKVAKNHEVISAIIAAIGYDSMNQGAIINALKGGSIGKNKVQNVLKDHAGVKVEFGKFWRITEAEKNAQVYTLNYGAEAALKRLKPS